jgi:hypothetical protein
MWSDLALQYFCQETKNAAGKIKSYCNLAPVLIIFNIFWLIVKKIQQGCCIPGQNVLK